MSGSKWILCVALLGVVSLLRCGEVAGAEARRGREPPAIPDTAVGRVFDAWLKALNGGDIKVLRAFYTRHGKSERVEEVVRQAATYARDTGGLECQQIEKSEATELTALLRTKLTERWIRATMK